jgi:hypothetical protein
MRLLIVFYGCILGNPSGGSLELLTRKKLREDPPKVDLRMIVFYLGFFNLSRSRGIVVKGPFFVQVRIFVFLCDPAD